MLLFPVRDSTWCGGLESSSWSKYCNCMVQPRGQQGIQKKKLDSRCIQSRCITVHQSSNEVYWMQVATATAAWIITTNLQIHKIPQFGGGFPLLDYLLRSLLSLTQTIGSNWQNVKEYDKDPMRSHYESEVIVWCQRIGSLSESKPHWKRGLASNRTKA